ncbi:hypothetical protein AXG93_1838s1010 [Marchantia polymorpha subsp. ruderalis]|uniref:Uncharacterized protein n=1 Tax=Marchantia polymorpha subsp. ruderalis TaxID=1480154 RepID=A0A176WGS2_MARPO|nr:hypothetical protein AXG93_1838s1010 [Marchantia polymorpha subsp. ruderalis]
MFYGIEGERSVDRRPARSAFWICAAWGNLLIGSILLGRTIVIDKPLFSFGFAGDKAVGEFFLALGPVDCYRGEHLAEHLLDEKWGSSGGGNLNP